MKGLKNYHRPRTLAEALAILEREGESAAVLGGGTALVAAGGNGIETVVDLQALGLDKINRSAGAITAGAMVRLQDLADYEGLPPIIRDGIYNEGPNTFRNMGTLGGVVAGADWESELLAALLACEAVVRLEGPAGANETRLSDFLAGPEEHLAGSIITGIAFQAGGETASARVARTPADRAIVAAAGRRAPDGTLRIALSRVARSPILADPDGLDALDCPGDFRGSAEYRRQMANVLVTRIREEIE